jgi:hypothetical protein
MSESPRGIGYGLYIMAISAMSWYLGAYALAPGIGMVAVVTVANKLKRFPTDPNYLNLVAVLVGYALWLMLGGFFAKNGVAIFEASAILAIAAWFWFRPGFWPLVTILLHSGVGFWGNFSALFQAPLASDLGKSLVTTIVIRLAICSLGVWAYWKQIKRARAEEAALFAHYSS